MADDGKAEENLPQLTAKHRLLVVAATGELDTRDEAGAIVSVVANSGCEMHPDTLEEALDMFSLDVCVVKARRGRTLFLTAHANEDVRPGTIALNDVACKNLGVSADAMQFVHVEYAGEDIRPLKVLSLAPIKETVGTRGDDDVKTHIRRYFEAAPTNAPATAGTMLRVDTPFGEPLWCKIQEVAVQAGPAAPADGAAPITDAGFVVVRQGRADQPPTELRMLAPLSQQECEEGLNAIGYADIGGLREQLSQIRNMVELPLRHPKIYKAIGVTAPKGVLMYGPPGCGKTLIAKAIANETGSYFVQINGPEVMKSKQGETEAEIRAKFDEAKENAPAILFIDEIDCLAPNRKDSGTNMQRVTTQLLTCMNGFDDDEHVVVIGATNRPNSLDPALRRAGRFDQEMVIPVPSESARLEILTILARKQKLAKDVDMEALAHQTHGYVGADLSNMCMKAAINCIRRNAAGVLDLEEDDIPDSFLQSLEVTMEDFYAALEITSPSILKADLIESPDVGFDDIGGMEDVKTALKNLVRLPVDHMEKFEKMGLEPRRGVLLFGPPGCGKTLLAKAMAAECGANFLSVAGPELISKWYGESEGNIRDLFDKARQAAPCVMFFDEIDSIASSRGSSTWSSGDVMDNVVNQLLTEMQGIGKRNNVFVVGATNKPGNIDAAITRPGRLDQPIEIGLPDYPARIGIFRACLRKTPVARNIDFVRMAEATDGYTGSDIQNICNQASKASVTRRIREDPECKTENWMLTAEDFATAFSESRPSLTAADLAEYRANAAALLDRMGSSQGDALGGTQTTLTGRYSRIDTTAAAGAGAGDDSDDDFYD